MILISLIKIKLIRICLFGDFYSVQILPKYIEEFNFPILERFVAYNYIDLKVVLCPVFFLSK